MYVCMSAHRRKRRRRRIVSLNWDETTEHERNGTEERTVEGNLCASDLAQATQDARMEGTAVVGMQNGV